MTHTDNNVAGIIKMVIIYAVHILNIVGVFRISL